MGGDDCLGGILVILFLIVVAVITLIAITIAIWLVTMWGRALHRTGHEKADAEGMLLLRDPQPMLSALRKAITSSNGIADGDPSYDGIFYASTSGKPGIDKVERRRYDRLREVLGVEGLAAVLPEEGSTAGAKTQAETDAEEGAEAGTGMPIGDYFDEKVFLEVAPAETFERGAEAAEHGRVEILQRGALSLRCRVTARASERGRGGERTHESAVLGGRRGAAVVVHLRRPRARAVRARRGQRPGGMARGGDRGRVSASQAAQDMARELVALPVVSPLRV